MLQGVNVEPEDESEAAPVTATAAGDSDDTKQQPQATPISTKVARKLFL